MTSENKNNINNPAAAIPGMGYPGEEVGANPVGGNYSDTESEDLNDSSHDHDNVDAPRPQSFDEEEENIVDRQLGIISRLAG